MFSESSRYAKQPTVLVPGPSGTLVEAVTIRRLPPVAGGAWEVKENDRLDLIAYTALADAPRFWRVADANTELDAASGLTATVGDIIAVPGRD
jgi:hypothetical protein